MKINTFTYVIRKFIRKAVKKMCLAHYKCSKVRTISYLDIVTIIVDFQKTYRYFLFTKYILCSVWQFRDYSIRLLKIFQKILKHNRNIKYTGARYKDKYYVSYTLFAREKKCSLFRESFSI